MSGSDHPLLALAGGLAIGRLEGGMHVPMLGGDGRQWLRKRTPLFHLVLVEGGRLGVRLADAPSVVCGPGSALLIPPGMVHDLVRQGVGGTISWADFTIDCWGAIPIAGLMDLPSRLPPASARALFGHVEALLRAPSTVPVPSRLAELCRHHGGMLAEVLALGAWKPDAAGRIDALLRLAPLFAELADRLAEPWPRQRLARAAGVAVTRLNQVFRAATGRPPAGFIRHLRLGRAAELLLTTALPLAALADRLGFVDAFHLSRAFKAEHGLAPAEYRRRWRRDPAGATLAMA